MVYRQPFGNITLCNLWDVAARSIKIRAKMQSEKENRKQREFKKPRKYGKDKEFMKVTEVPGAVKRSYTLAG